MPLKKSIVSLLIFLFNTSPLVPVWAVDEEPSGGTGGETVVEVPDTTLPTLVTARVEKEKITLTTSEPLNEKLVPAGGVFIVQVDGAPRAVVATRVSGNLVTLILEHPVVSTQSVTLSYPPPTENMLQDLSGNALAAIENQSVTNNTPATPRIPKSSRYLYLGDQKIATIEDQLDGTKRTITHLTDHLGGSNIDTGTNGDILQITDYLPFGSERIVLEKTNTYKNKYRFIGKERDTESDLLYVEARYYDSDLGRFISQDPVFWEAGNTQRGQQSLIDPQSLHSYSYARNNPIVYSDPSGEYRIELRGREVDSFPVNIFPGTYHHSFIYIASEEGDTLQFKPFTLSATREEDENGRGILIKHSNMSGDYDKTVSQLTLRAIINLGSDEKDQLKFIAKLLDAYNRYRNDRIYDASGQGVGSRDNFVGNSNNFSTYLLNEAGLSLDKLKGLKAEDNGVLPGLGKSFVDKDKLEDTRKDKDSKKDKK